MTDPLHRLVTVGLTTPWGVWRLARGGFDEDCDRCEGTGVTVRSACLCREPLEPPGPCACTRAHGCAHCALRCRYCLAGRLRPPGVRAEDFGDADSRALAEQLFPGLDIDEAKRVDWDAPALEGYP